jgi:hypothetical protein
VYRSALKFISVRIGHCCKIGWKKIILIYLYCRPYCCPCIAIIWSCSQPCSLALLSLLAVWFEPTDTRKAGKVFQSRHWTSLGYVSPNLNELQVMSLASGKVCYLYVKFSIQIGLNIITLRHNLHYRDNHIVVKIQSILHCE